jgi:hypothetical protein
MVPDETTPKPPATYTVPEPMISPLPLAVPQPSTVLLTVVTMVEMSTDCALGDAVIMLSVTGGETALLDLELLDDAVTTTMMVELEITVTEVISLRDKAIERADAVEDELEFDVAVELAWFGARVETPTLTVPALEVELELKLVELAVLKLLELDGLAVLVVVLLKNSIVVLDRNTPVVYVYDMLALMFDRHEAGMVKQHGNPLDEIVDGANTPE